MADQAPVQTCQRVSGSFLITSVHTRSGSSISSRPSDFKPLTLNSVSVSCRNSCQSRLKQGHLLTSRTSGHSQPYQGQP